MNMERLASHIDYARAKSSFMAHREILGVTRAHLAKMLDTDTAMVEAWEDPASTIWPTQEAFDLLSELARTQAIAVATSLEVVAEIIEDNAGKEPSVVELTYWHDALHFAKAHPEEDPANWQMANANARKTYRELIQRYDGIDVMFGFPGLRKTLEDNGIDPDVNQCLMSVYL